MGPKRKPIDVRFWAKVEKSDCCWNWTGKPNNGYGMIGDTSGKMIYAHRFSWELHNGSKVPSGLVVRHKCDNKMCVNPDHLEIGTQKDNIADMINRGRKAIIAGDDHYFGKRTHCSNGHEFTEDNTYWRPCGGRACKICCKNRAAEYRKRKQNG